MKKKIKQELHFNLKEKLLLTILCIIGVILLLPYVLELQKDVLEKAKLPFPLPILLTLQVIQNAIIFLIMVFIGAAAAERTGFKIPIISNCLNKKPFKKELINFAKIAIPLGVLVGFLIIILDGFVFAKFAESETGTNIQSPSWWSGLLASFYGGINEEVFCRFFVMSIIVYITQRVIKKKNQPPSKLVAWFSIIISAILFGLGHLPTTALITNLTILIVIRALVLNGIVAITYGWLYWKKGLEAAMISHFSTDIVLHVIFAV